MKPKDDYRSSCVRVQCRRTERSGIRKGSRSLTKRLAVNLVATEHDNIVLHDSATDESAEVLDREAGARATLRHALVVVQPRPVCARERTSGVDC